MDKIFIIGICGRSRCGKDSIAQSIASVNPHVLHINADTFFKTSSGCSRKKGYECWEHDDVIRWDHLCEVISALKSGKGIVIQDRSLWYGSYDCEIFPEDIPEYNIIIVQGYLLFTNKKILDLLDTKIFIDVNDENILYRRLKKIEDKNYIHDVVIPVSKEYENMQKRAAEIIFDSNENTSTAITNDAIKYINLQLYNNRFEDNLLNPNKKNVSVWQVYPGDLISDHEWHPIDFDDLKGWTKDKMHSSKTLYGNAFEYRKNPNSSNYQVRLSKEWKNYRHIFRYTLDQTPPKKSV